MKKLLFLLMVIALVLSACGGDGDQPSNVTTTESTESGSPSQANFDGKKIVWLDSYHEGYAWSDGIQEGIESTLVGTGIELLIVRLDTKHVLEDTARREAAQRVHTEIEAFGPDVIIASDDDAQTYVVVPYYRGTEMPVVFAGVNYDAEPYGYPASNVTGMVEVDQMKQVVDQLLGYASGTRIALLTDDTTTSYRIADEYRNLFRELETVVFTNSYAEFKASFLELQDQVDIVLMHNNSGVSDWDEADAEVFFAENTRVPTGAVHDFMSPYALLTISVVAHEQGEWAAQTAMQIMGGTRPDLIPVVRNMRGDMYVNMAIAAHLNIALPPSVLRNATLIGADSIDVAVGQQ